MAGKDYDVAAAFRAIEYELINSFFRNMKKHKVDEVNEQKEWEMWQVKQLQELDLYKKRNAKKYGTKFTDINKIIAEMIRLANEEGQMDQEAEILSAMKKGLRPQRAPEQMTAQFFRTNDRKLDTLINATVSDMERAEVAVLRKADDVYRKTIFSAMVYANTGAGTYEKAVDMATKDFMKAGLTCVEYKNGSKHTISDYADMAVRTANKRAYLQGEGTKRQEWGIHTVIVNKRLRACPHCMPFAGKVFIDDVWGGGTAADGNYPMLSTAIEAGLYHPRCKDSHTAYFPGISDRPKKYTKAEVKEAEKTEEQERKVDYAERQAESYQRVADTRLDPENKRAEQAKADRWKEFQSGEYEKREAERYEPVKNLGEAQEKLADILGKAHENRRERFSPGLSKFTPQEAKEAFMQQASFGKKMDVEMANGILRTLTGLVEEYTTTLSEVRPMTGLEYMSNLNSFAGVYHTYSTNESALILNLSKLNHYDKHIERVRELSDDGFLVNIPAGREEEYMATHEFAHSLLGMTDKLSNKHNYVGTDYGMIKAARKEIEKVYKDYLNDLEPIEIARSKAELESLEAYSKGDMEAAMKADEAYAKADEAYRKICISEYSKENSDEFLAESFTQCRMNDKEECSKYAERTAGILDKYFKR